MTYDSWKIINPDDDLLGPEPPPCQLGYAYSYDHPRFPSGDCVICGALCTQGCKHPLAVGEYAPNEDGP